MKFPTTRIEQISIDPTKRVLVTSDIHGCLSCLQNVLKKAEFCDDDILVIVGDIIEKGPDSLGTLRYVMELCERGNVIPLIGNVDAYRLKLMFELSEENAATIFNYVVYLRGWNGACFYDELAKECGCKLDSPEELLAVMPAIMEHFHDELEFLASLPAIVETQNYIFVHGGLREKNVLDNADRDIFELTKYDDFASKTPHVFDKYVVVGHWPVSLYNESVQQHNPVVNQDKRIVSIDGGCGVKKGSQLNLLILPGIECSVSEMSFVSYDEIPTVCALEDQQASVDSVNICWSNREVEMLERGEEFSLILHKHSGHKLHILNSYLKNDSEAYDYTNYVLPVRKGDCLSLLKTTSKGCIVKKDGVVGWYFGGRRPQ